MRSKLRLRNCAILIALVALTLMIGLYGTTNRSKTDGGNGGISLEPPFFISAAEAAETGIMAFPADKAGISAYVKFPTTIDLDKVRTIFTSVEDIGDNYIIGTLPVSNKGEYPKEEIQVYLYADINGWLVAYFTREMPAAQIMKWPLKIPSKITQITTTTLQEALRNAGQAAGDIPHEIKYYDFRFPNADTMTLFVKVSDDEPAITQVKIPANWTLYEASYSVGCYYGDSFRRVKVDGASFSWRGPRSYQGAIAVGTLHTIETTYAPIATVFIYRKY